MKRSPAVLPWGILLVQVLGLALSTGCAQSVLREPEATGHAGTGDGLAQVGMAGGAAGAMSTAGHGTAGTGTAGGGTAGMGAAGHESAGTGGIDTGGSNAPPQSVAGTGGLPPLHGRSGSDAPTPPAPGTGGAPPREDLVPPPTIEVGPGASLSAGRWLGQTREALRCTPDSRRVAMQLWPQSGSTPAHGVVVFGDRDPPPSATDPDQAYPPGVGWDACVDAPMDGFAYQILDGHVDASGRFSFRIAVHEPYEAWCAMQSSYEWLEGFSCVPQAGNEERNACSSRTGCIVNLYATLRFDVTMDASNMAGVITMLRVGDARGTEVRLRKVP